MPKHILRNKNCSPIPSSQHFKVCEFGGDDCIKAPSVVDRTAHKYSDRLVRRVDEIYNQLKRSCKLADLPKVPDVPKSAPTKKTARFKGRLIGEIVNGFGSSAQSPTKSDGDNSSLSNRPESNVKRD